MYSGSPAKENVRRCTYNSIMKGMGIKRFRESKHIVIASRECGDIRMLHHLYVPMENIIACDIDPMAREQAQQWGVKVSEHPTIQDTVAAYGGREVGSINIDLCKTLPSTENILRPIFDVECSSWITSAWIAITFFRARDNMSVKTDPNVRSNYLRDITGEDPVWLQDYNSYAFGKKNPSPMTTALYKPME